MFSASSLKSIPVTQNKFKEEIGEKVPFFAEWIIAQCGQLSEQERYAHTMLLVLSKEDATKRFSIGYIEYLNKKFDDISNCRKQAIVKEQSKRIEKMI